MLKIILSVLKTDNNKIVIYFVNMTVLNKKIIILICLIISSIILITGVIFQIVSNFHSNEKFRIIGPLLILIGSMFILASGAICLVYYRENSLLE